MRDSPLRPARRRRGPARAVEARRPAARPTAKRFTRYPSLTIRAPLLFRSAVAGGRAAAAWTPVAWMEDAMPGGRIGRALATGWFGFTGEKAPGAPGRDPGGAASGLRTRPISVREVL